MIYRERIKTKKKENNYCFLVIHKGTYKNLWVYLNCVEGIVFFFGCQKDGNGRYTNISPFVIASVQRQVLMHQYRKLQGEKKLVSEIDLPQLTILTKMYPVPNCNPSNYGSTSYQLTLNF